MQVTSNNFAKLTKFIFVFFIIFSVSACKLTDEKGFLPKTAYMPERVSAELQYLSNNGIISNETNRWINSMIINKCLAVEYYANMECEYPQFNHAPNVRDAR